MLIGITGGSGTGKSLVANEIRKYNIPVIDADTVAREVTEKGSPALLEIKEKFGEAYISEDGTLLRKKLGSLVFSDPEKLELLNTVISKYIRICINEKLSSHKEPIVCIDAPLLIEYGLNEQCDIVISVLADTSLRAKRITERDKISQEDALNRIKIIMLN